jgi:hypothetical protein
MYPDGFNQIDNGVQSSVTVFTGDRSYVNMQHADLFPVGGFKTFHWRLHSLFAVEYDIAREKSTRPVWAPSRRLDRKKPSGRRAADAIAYT